MSNILLEKNREIAPEGRMRLSQSRNDAQLWMCLVVKGKSHALKNNTSMTSVFSWKHSVRLDLLTPKKKKNVLCIIEDWNAKVGSQELPGVTGKSGLGL